MGFFVSVTILLSVCVMSSSGLRICSKFEACNLLEYSFPPPQPTTTTPDPESSGEGSGESISLEQTLVYDEIMYRGAVYPPNPDNYTSVETHNFCSCPDSTCPDPNNTNDDNSVRLDAFLSLTFCGGVQKLFPHPCKGRRAVTRVFGKPGVPDPDPMLTTTMNEYTKTRFFCHCKSGVYEKLPKIETWNPYTGIYAYVYHCVH